MFVLIMANIVIPIIITLGLLVVFPSRKPLEDANIKEIFYHFLKCFLVLTVCWTIYNCTEINSSDYKKLKGNYEPEIIQMTKKALKDDNKISRGEFYLIEMKELLLMFRDQSRTEEYQKNTYKQDLINK